MLEELEQVQFPLVAMWL